MTVSRKTQLRLVLCDFCRGLGAQWRLPFIPRSCVPCRGVGYMPVLHVTLIPMPPLGACRPDGSFRVSSETSAGALAPTSAGHFSGDAS